MHCGFDLDAQRSLCSAQQALVTVRLARLNNLVTVYGVLGGGWSDTAFEGDRGAGSTTSPPPAR